MLFKLSFINIIDFISYWIGYVYLFCVFWGNMKAARTHPDGNRMLKNNKKCEKNV